MEVSQILTNQNSRMNKQSFFASDWLKSGTPPPPKIPTHKITPPPPQVPVQKVGTAQPEVTVYNRWNVLPATTAKLGPVTKNRV